MMTINATNEQMELGFSGIKILPAQHESRIARANWWFAKMRQTVAGAMDWNASAIPRPEQMWIPGASRQIEV